MTDPALRRLAVPAPTICGGPERPEKHLELGRFFLGGRITPATKIRCFRVFILPARSPAIRYHSRACDGPKQGSTELHFGGGGGEIAAPSVRRTRQRSSPKASRAYACSVPGPNPSAKAKGKRRLGHDTSQLSNLKPCGPFAA